MRKNPRQFPRTKLCVWRAELSPEWVNISMGILFHSFSSTASLFQSEKKLSSLLSKLCLAPPHNAHISSCGKIIRGFEFELKLSDVFSSSAYLRCTYSETAFCFIALLWQSRNNQTVADQSLWLHTSGRQVRQIRDNCYNCSGSCSSLTFLLPLILTSLFPSKIGIDSVYVACSWAMQNS